MLKFGALLILIAREITARQLQTSDGSSLWIATINDEYNCDNMTEKIKVLSSMRKSMRKSNDIDKMKGDDNCFVEFSGSDDFAHDVIGKLEGVDNVSPNEEVSLFLWGRDRADQDNLPLDGAPYNPPFNGDGQCLYIIDTGILPEHNDFTGRAKFGGDFINENNLEDNNGHGTHCSSIAAGATYGIAPATTNIYAVKVLDGYGVGSSTGVIKGIQWSVSHANKMKKTCVLSLSLGGNVNVALDKAAEKASKKHFVIVAAGNSNMSACKTSPARAGGNVITVGSTNINDYRSSFSNFGKCVNIFGPGSGIEAAYIGGKNTTKTLSGTSMATPFIAGLALQALQKNNGRYMAAYKDLMTNAIANKIKDVGSDSPNLLGRSFTYTDSPTKRFPITRPPTILLRCDNTKDEEICRAREKCAWDGFVCFIRYRYQNKNG